MLGRRRRWWTSIKVTLDQGIEFSWIYQAGLDDSFDPVIARNSDILGSNIPRRIFVIESVYIQCSKLFKNMYCAVLSMVIVHYKEPLKSFDKSKA